MEDGIITKPSRSASLLNTSLARRSKISSEVFKASSNSVASLAIKHILDSRFAFHFNARDLFAICTDVDLMLPLLSRNKRFEPLLLFGRVLNALCMNVWSFNVIVLSLDVF